MRPDLNRDQMTKVLIPKGELLRDFMTILSLADSELRSISSDSLAFMLTRLSLPLLFVATRARDVQKIIDNSNDVNFGFTGTDIIAEQQLQVKARLPMVPGSTQSDIVFASTPNWNERVARPAKENFPESSTIVTPYPRLTAQFVSENVMSAKVLEVLGATEGIWWADSNTTAVVDVQVTGKTMRANRVNPIETVLENISIALVATRDARDISRDAQVIDDLMARVTKNMRRK